MKFPSLRVRLALLLLLAAAPALVVLLYTASQQRSEQITVQQERLAALATDVASVQRDEVAATSQMLATISAWPVVQSAQPSAECDQLLAGVVSSHPQYAAVWIAGSDGTIFCASQAGSIGAQQSAFFAAATPVAGHTLLRGAPRTLPGSGHTVLDYVRTASSAAGAPLSVGVSIELAAAGSGLGSGAALPAKSALALVDSSGAVVYSSNPALHLGAPLLASGQFARLVAAPGGAMVLAAAGGLWLYTLSPLAPGQTVMGLRVAAGMPSAVATAAADAELQRDLLLLLLLLLAVVAAWLGVERAAVRPLRRLAETAGRLAAGDADARAGLHGGAEIERLGSAFDRMAGELQARDTELRQRERRFRSLIENSIELVIIVDAQARLTYVSPSVERLLGLPASSFAGANGLALLHNGDLQRLRQGFERAVAAPGLHSLSDLRLPHADGGWRWFDATLNNLLDDPNVGGVVCTLHDVTERRNALAEARGARERYQALFEDAPVMYAVIEQRGALAPIVDCNALLLETLGYSREEVIGRVLTDFMSPRSAQAASGEQLYLHGALAGLVERERELVTRGGETIVALMRGRPEPGRAGEPLRIRTAFVDVTAPRAALEEARQAQAQYRALFEEAPAMYAILEEQAGSTPIIDCNALFLATLGYERDEVIGRTLPDLFTLESARLALEEESPRPHHLRGPIQRERDFLTRDGEVVHALLRATPEESVGGRPPRLRAMFVDITARREAEAALRRAQDRIETVLNNVPIGLFEFDRQGVITLVESSGIARSEAANSIVGATIDEAFAARPPIIAAIRRALAGETVAAVFDFETISYDARYVPLRDTDGAVVGVSGVALDITERRRAERALQQVEMSLRTAVGGVPLVIFTTDRHGVFTLCEGKGLEPLGIDGRGFVGQSYALVCRDLPEYQAYFRRALAGETVQASLLANDLVFEARFAPAYDADGAIAGVVGVALDVTAQHRTETTLIETRARLQSTIANAPIIVYELDAAGRFTFIEGTRGADRQPTTGLSAFAVYRDYPPVIGALEQALAGAPGSIVAEVEGVVYDIRYSPVRDAAGLVTGVSGLALDVSDRVRAESALHEAQERLQSVVGKAPIVLFAIDEAGYFRFAEGHALTLLGTSAAEVVGMHITEAYEDAPEALAHARRALAGESVEGTEVINDRVLEVRHEPVLDAQGRVIGTTGVALDVTERRAVEQELRQSRAQMQTLVDNVPLMLSRFDKDGIFTLSEGNGLRLLGIEPGELVGRSIFAVYGDNPLLLGYLRSALAGETVEATVEVHGAVFDLRYVPERDADGAVIAVAGVALDATARREAETALAHQAFHDALTGLPNRALFLNRLDQALLRAERRGGGVGLLFLDLDQFKVVNDSLGHTAGDELLVQTAARISACVRAEDTVARLGGDEFTVVVENAAAAAYAAEMAERILAAFSQPFLIGGREIFATPSIGVACCAGSAADLLRRADVALYQAKAAGRARVVAFDERMDERARARLELEADLHRALARGELEVFYQPVVELATGTIVGVEALVRWRHPERGLVTPDEFIPLAEETGLILPLGRWVLEEACRQAAAWRAELPERRLTVAVNLSARQLQDSDMGAQIAEALAASGLPAELLELELTESMLIGDVDGSLRTLLALRQLGVKLAMDDFGTGYSSLSYLARLPVDTLKIDQSFTRRLTTDSGTAAIVEATVTLAHALGMSITAEGIETPEELARLRALRCERGQGFYFCRPLPAAELRRVLDDEALNLDLSAS